ncbi:MAG: hypothetical protein SPL52_13850 [Fibrobacter sp.]|nr:hypothetical protein [Fibrobacter sp.]
MNKLMLTCAMSLMLLSTSAMALTINVEPKKEESSRVAPPPPPPPPAPSITCKFAEPKCDRHDRIHAERYNNDQKMYSRGECYRGEKERKFDFYCDNGDVWMQIDYRRDRADRIDCRDPRRGKFFAARSISECEDLYRNNYRRMEKPHKKHHYIDRRD